jgi:alpha-tubulin suppressor-like RCC1 family protein
MLGFVGRNSRFHALIAIGLCVGLLTALMSIGTAAAVSSPASSPGTLVSWGNDAGGELGIPADNTNLAYGSPTAVDLPAGTQVTQVATGDGHALALTSTGAVYAWGDGNNGDLGQGSGTAAETTPVEVDFPAGAQIAAVAAGEYTSYAITTAGDVYAWGDDESGQLGNGTTEAVGDVNAVPTLIPGLTGVTQIIADGFNYVMGVVALTSSGQVYTWGSEYSAQLGNGVDGDSTQFDPTPTALGLSDVTQIAGGTYDFAALTGGGSVYGWGVDGCDELGNNVGDNCRNGFDETTPVPIDFPAGVVVDSIGLQGGQPGHGIAADSNGNVYIWGQGTAYSDGAYYTPSVFPVPGNAPVIQVDATGYCNYALTAGGVLYANGASDDSCGFGTSGSSLLSALQAVPMSAGMHVEQFAGADGYGAAVEGPSLPGTPTVTALSPASGPTTGANTVTVSGTGFAPGAAVYFGTQAGTNVSVKSSKQLTVSAPAGSGTVDVFVAENGTSSPLTSADKYTYTTSSGTGSPSSGPGGPSGSGGSGGSGSGGSGAGSVRVSGVATSGTSASLKLSCSGAGKTCTITTTMSVIETVEGGKVIAIAASAAPKKTVKRVRKTVTLGSIKTTLKAGQSRKVTVALNKAGKKLLSAKRNLSVHLVITEGGRKLSTKTLKFKAGSKRRG